ncbi:UVR8 [Symbiodinium natans]|uniref:UVR8 protein n=1 Tax=Symbiodinium natans TaxID=878477 RepID=A0A812JB86_9DINO|nr:UVR8 [Symbiodinium natans]
MIWCVPIPENGVVVSRLLPNPSVVCWSDDHMASAGVAMVGLGVWCFGIPVTLAARLLCLRDRQAPENFRRFGYFFQGLEAQFWWWDLIVKRLDVALMMLVTYTSFVLDPKAKLMLFPVLSGVQVFLAAWIRPYANDQAEILDVVEVTLSMIRFLLFSAVATLLVLQPPANTTHMVAYTLFMVLLLACVYFTAHFTAQVLRDVAVGPSPAQPGSRFSKASGAIKSFVLKLALPLFTEAESDSLQLAWSFLSEKVTVTMPTSASRKARLTSWQTAASKSRTKALLALAKLSKNVLRHGPQFQQATILKACTCKPA